MEQGTNVAGVQFRTAGKIYDFRYNELKLNVGDQVLVETERGNSLARVVMLKFELAGSDNERELKSVLRKAAKKELEKKSRLSDQEVVSFAKDKISSLKLDMNILTAENQFGGNKIILFFTAPGRVDFRELVKELASGLKTRVELKQVGARDETKLVGGTGICGREFCCSSFLREFVPVSIKMAKNQNLALNPNKVSGGCGRLLCCLTYEDDTYSALRKNLPRRGTRVFIPELGGHGKILKGDILNQEVLVEDERGQQDTFALSDIEISEKKNEKQATIVSDDWGDDLDLDALEQFSESAKQNTQKAKNPRMQQASSRAKENSKHFDRAGKNESQPRNDGDGPGRGKRNRRNRRRKNKKPPTDNS